MTLALRYAARTHLGLGPKSRNEDSGYAGPHLLVLADGMGGHAAGDVASSMIVGALAHLDGEGLSAEQALRALEEELANANAGLRRAIRENEDLAGMGSTTIAVLQSGSKLAMAHIGDSRAYLLRDGTFTQITKDHSFVQQLVDEARITQQEATGHPQRSLVTRVMTGNPDDHPDLSVRELHLGDRYLLCSDGLSDFVSADVIQEILTKAPEPGRGRRPAGRGRRARQRPRQHHRRAGRRRRPRLAAGHRYRAPGRRRGSGPQAAPAHPRHPDQPRREGRRPDPRGVRRTRRG